MYADDLVIYCKAKEEEATEVLKCLQTFCQCTRQDINFNKSTINFSHNIKTERKQRILRILKMTECDHKSSYLGLPFCKTQMNLTSLSAITNKVKSRLASWKGRMLSFAGRGVLVNSVAQTIPAYAMQTYLLPNVLCHKLNELIRDFWWGKQDQNIRKLYFKA